LPVSSFSLPAGAGSGSGSSSCSMTGHQGDAHGSGERWFWYGTSGTDPATVRRK
jgi:hypothetical protein